MALLLSVRFGAGISAAGNGNTSANEEIERLRSQIRNWIKAGDDN